MLKAMVTELAFYKNKLNIGTESFYKRRYLTVSETFMELEDLLML